MTKHRKLEAIPYTTVSTFIGKESEGTQAETWKVALRGKPNSINAYVKFSLNHRQTIAELVCSQIGRALGLNISKSYLVYIDTDNLPEHVISSSLYASRGKMLAFASSSPDPEAMSFERLIHMDNNKANEMFELWKELENVIAFDEWIANPDRTDCNYLYTPQDNDFWLIDHGSALTGDYMPNWALNNPQVETHNALYESIAHQNNLTQKHELKEKAAKLMERANTIDFSEIDSDGYHQMIDPKVNNDDIANFLKTRIDHSVELLCQKMGIPQLV